MVEYARIYLGISEGQPTLDSVDTLEIFDQRHQPL